MTVDNVEKQTSKHNKATAERKQRILSEGTYFDKPFGLIPVSEIKSAAEIQANIEKIIASLKANEGSKNFKSFEGFAYGGKYAKNAGEQIREYLISIDVLPLDIRKEFAENIGVTNNDELVSWGEKKYNELNQSEQPLEKVKGITVINEEDNGKTLVYGTKSVQTKLSVKKYTAQEIKEELDFETKKRNDALVELQENERLLSRTPIGTDKGHVS